MHDDATPTDHNDPVRIGCVSYLNTAPMIEGLERARAATLIPAPPARLVDLLNSTSPDAAEVALLSVIDAQKSPSPVALIPCGMIGCDGPTLTVRLYSAIPIEQITRVHADSESHTGVALLRVILAERYNRSPQFIEFDARERIAHARDDDRAAHDDAHSVEASEWPEAMLLIGDKVVTDSPPAVRYPYQLDLGEAWKELTGLPFVYAVWACLEKNADSPRVRAAAILLDRQRRHNATRLDWIITHRAPQRGWPIDLAQRYLHDLLRYDVGAREREAIERFFDLAHKHNVLASRRPVRWLDDALAPRDTATPCHA
jgi:chorismate dehydratase